MSTQVFSGGMDHEISTKLERALEDGCRHCVITDEVSTGVVCDFRCPPKVSDPYLRVRRSLRENEPGIRTNSLLCLRNIRHINKRYFQAPGDESISEQFPDT